MQREIDSATRAACQAVKLLRQHKIPLPPGLASFAREHDMLDAKRRADERLDRNEKAQRQAALTKLSPQERRLLGVR